MRYASLMVGRPAAAEAARIARDNPGLGVGLHLELCADAPEKAGLRYFFDAKARAGLDGEIRGQLDALLELGVTPTHVDGHINVHVHPVVFPALCRVAREYKIPRVRLPGGSGTRPRPSRGPGRRHRGPGGRIRGDGRLGGGAAAGLEVPRTWGLLRSGLMKEDYVLWLLARLPEGDTELYFHPTTDPRLRATDVPAPSHQSVTELETLLSPRVRAALDREGIALAGPVRA
ncbi:MAG: ChbG/HpnK family deacetylase [Elusimicrobiota bacterium]|nr:MAG: ChbG/HpnK family deacetylase [Elusimicrobiota bacterium]